MENFDFYLKKIKEYGQVVGIRESVVLIEGLPSVKLNELIVFEEGIIGQVINVDEDIIQAVVMDRLLPDIGEKVVRTDDFLSFTVSHQLLGTMIDSLGRVIYPAGRIVTGQVDSLFKEISQPIWQRAKITKPLLTGVSMVDLLMPLGEGQKELIIGERKTGKTSFLLTTVKNQIEKNKVIIFCAIGKKKTDIRALINYFEKENIFNKVILISTSSDDSPYLIYLAPFTAMAVAEYFKEKGQDSLVILDDLSTHAKFYREISLLNNKFPGRESYPGDIFYLHASLLERAGNFKDRDNKNISITCLPVAEVVEGDFTGYITTNLMGITDGHIFFDQAIFAKGIRPAINLLLSVTRVGRQTQSKLLQEINHEVTAFLSQYEAIKNLIHFGAELSDSIKKNIERGRRVEKALEQKHNEIIPLPNQAVLLTIAYDEDFFDWDIDQVKENLIKQKIDDRFLEVDSFNELKNKILENKKNYVGQ
jgi:F-type H+-transporting ATPase subunit alpha